jgi:aspartate aminotransferase
MKAVTISARAAQAPASPIRKLVPLAEGARARGLKVYGLNIGQPDIETPPEMLKAVRDMKDKVISYSPSGGTPECRRAFFEYYDGLGFPVAEDELLVTTAGSEALIFALACATNPGDQVLIPEPLYANYIGFSSLLGLTVTPITTTPENGYHLPDPAAIERLITSNTKALIFANPGNPTGAVYTRDEVSSLVELGLKHGLYLIADEVYREFTYDGVTATSIMSFPEVADRAVVTDSISKRYSACGARIGCLVSKNVELVASAMKFAQARLSPPSLGQALAAAAVKLPPGYFEKTRQEYERRRDLVCDVLASIPGVVCSKPEGAFYVMPKLPIADTDEFAKWMLESFSLNGETLLVAPGAGFYATPGAGTSEARIAYVLNLGELEKAMEVLRVGIDEYKNTVETGSTAKGHAPQP